MPTYQHMGDVLVYQYWTAEGILAVFTSWINCSEYLLFFIHIYVLYIVVNFSLLSTFKFIISLVSFQQNELRAASRRKWSSDLFGLLTIQKPHSRVLLVWFMARVRIEGKRLIIYLAAKHGKAANWVVDGESAQGDGKKVVNCTCSCGSNGSFFFASWV